ncbi:unnamed protein product [Peniophora sp. CBMAI 1063]|nr:unnamed protein product [Peniophora sp. CBMAI 1063]
MSTTRRRQPRLVDLPREIWQYIALEVVAAVLAEQDSHRSLPFPDSLLPNLEGSTRLGRSDSIGMNPAPLWDEGLSPMDCTCSDGWLSGQTQHCYSDPDYPPHRNSSILALLAICRELREPLIGFQALWAQIALMFPQFLPDSLIWAGNNPNHPLRLETLHGLCSCVLPMIVTRAHRATHIRLAIPLKRSYGTHPSDQIFNLLRDGPNRGRLLHAEFRYDPYYAGISEIAFTRFAPRRLPGLLSFTGVNNPEIGFSDVLTKLELASLTEDMTFPVDFVSSVLRKCHLLEHLVLQMVLDDPSDTIVNTRPIRLMHLKFFLLCDTWEYWDYIKVRLACPAYTSIHPDIVIDDPFWLNNGYRGFARAVTRECFGSRLIPCDVVILDCHRGSPPSGVLEYIRFTFAQTEAAAWAERDPSNLAARLSLTFRFQSIAIQKRYPPNVSSWRNFELNADHERIISDVLLGISEGAVTYTGLEELESTHTFIQKGDGGSRHLDTCGDLANLFPNLQSIVLHGVTNPSYPAVCNLVAELARPAATWGALERVRLPDWAWSDVMWGEYNARIQEQDPDRPGGVIEWST